MKRFFLIFLLLLSGMTVHAKEEEPKNLHAQSAVLMDAETGRVLFEKNGYEKRAMASTTKIMTCILALEKGNVDDVVTASGNAAGQPRVHLGMREGEQFYLRDLLYSLMLESHNDSAVAIAEHLAGSVEGFAKWMNEKAKEIGCHDTYFITPNGLDAVDETGVHSTTAEELAKIMSYCITKSPQKNLFLEITATKSKSFSNVAGTREFSCNNHNAFLTMMEGAISGKTGFTGDAGYCYVGALRRENRTFVVALLACGWPNHKGYKWQDTRKLMEYGIRNYTYRDVFEEMTFPEIQIENGIPEDDSLFGTATATLAYDLKEKEKELKLLLSDEDAVEVRTKIEDTLSAPVRYGTKAGEVSYYLNGESIKVYKVIVTKRIKNKNFPWYFTKIVKNYFLLNNR